MAEIHTERYVALLRGVNVGGKNKVSMSLLKAAFEQEGFREVSTYINSGNVIFSCSKTDSAFLQQKCRQAVQNQFQLDIPVAVLSARDFSAAMDHAPVWWDHDRESKHIAIFVIAPASAAAMVQEIGIKQAYEQVAQHGQVIFWSAPIRTFSRTRWSNIVASAAYSTITIRNANTVKKLLQLSIDNPQYSAGE